jgi:hypothetical protein
MKYNGVKIGRQITDFVAGVSSPLDDKFLNLSGDWDNYRPEHENQNRGMETYACTIFAGLDVVESLFMYHLHNDDIPTTHIKFLTDKGYFKNGFINFSDRLPANFADIEIGKGTYVFKANNAIRRFLIPEDMFPYCKDDYYNKDLITEEMLNLAKEFNEYFEINWQIEEDPTIGLKKSPLTAIVRYANGTGILKPEGELNHLIMVYKEAEKSFYIDDSYIPRDKRYGKDYVFHFHSFKLTIKNKINMDIQKFFKDNDLKFVRNESTGAFARVIRQKLRTIETKDRGTLLLLDNEHRKNGITINNSEWEKLPKELF